MCYERKLSHLSGLPKCTLMELLFTLGLQTKYYYNFLACGGIYLPWEKLMPQQNKHTHVTF